MRHMEPRSQVFVDHFGTKFKHYFFRTKIEHYALPPQDGRWHEHPKAKEELEVGARHGTPGLTPPPTAPGSGGGEGSGGDDGDAPGTETLTIVPGGPDPTWLRCKISWRNLNILFNISFTNSSFSHWLIFLNIYVLLSY